MLTHDEHSYVTPGLPLVVCPVWCSQFWVSGAARGLNRENVVGTSEEWVKGDLQAFGHIAKGLTRWLRGCSILNSTLGRSWGSAHLPVVSLEYLSTLSELPPSLQSLIVLERLTLRLMPAQFNQQVGVTLPWGAVICYYTWTFAPLPILMDALVHPCGLKAEMKTKWHKGFRWHEDFVCVCKRGTDTYRAPPHEGGAQVLVWVVFVMWVRVQRDLSCSREVKWSDSLTCVTQRLGLKEAQWQLFPAEVCLISAMISLLPSCTEYKRTLSCWDAQLLLD